MTSVDPHLRNELLFREVNEHIADIAATADASDQIEVLCECGDEACIATIVMRLGEYSEREGRLGLMLFTVTETLWTNQDGALVKTQRDVLIRY